MSDSNLNIWDEIKLNLKKILPKHTFHSFVEPALCEHYNENEISLKFKDGFAKENFEERCYPLIKTILKNQKIESLNILMSIEEPSEIDTPGTQYDLFSYEGNNPFDSKYTFETFVVGTSNQFAHAACLAVAHQPGECYNPLFIFGVAGLGKTHLLKAIGHEIFNKQKSQRILYRTSESFTNELIQAIRQDRMKEFREKYRQGCDVLLLDDIHFFAGKERTQEEFFYTFNYLHESRKQIIVTSDRYPKDITGLENRLQTRFEWGLVADVQPPEIETRIAILKNKADKEKIYLPDDVAHFIASYITSNIRELEGSLHRLQAYASLTGASISVELAQQIIKDLAPKHRHEITPEGIIKLVALHFNIRVTDLKSEKRERKLSMPRQVAMYLLRKHTLLSFPELGKFMGKDHSTILHGVQKITKSMKYDSEILNHITKIEGLMR
jgi:chromosomal replication initiator protein